MTKLKTEMLLRLVSRPQLSGVRVGRVIAVQTNGQPLVDYPGNAFGPLAARTTASVRPAVLQRVLERGGEVLLAFGGPDSASPILFDVVRERSPRPVKVARQTPESPPGSAPKATEAGSPRLGRIVGIQDGAVLVDFEGNAGGPRPARTTVPLRNLKDAVLLQFLPGEEPVVVGQLFDEVRVEESGGAGADVVLKGQRVRIEAETEVELVAGGSKIRLDARGKAETTADQVVSRARGANKVQGACVQLN